ncbi:MAG: PspC domain-containing protein [Pseudomonadota bacterium]|nr:PspC domain-containing protein [Pseudomonadota bacterium]
MILNVNRDTDRWVRNNDGWVAGVCEGLAKALGIEPWIVRLIWLIGILFLGLSIFVYVGLMFSLPRESQVAQAYQPKILGVCNELSQRFQTEVGLTRFLTLVLAVSSLGVTVILYLVLYLVFSRESGNTFKNTL